MKRPRSLERFDEVTSLRIQADRVTAQCLLARQLPFEHYPHLSAQQLGRACGKDYSVPDLGYLQHVVTKSILICIVPTFPDYDEAPNCKKIGHDLFVCCRNSVWVPIILTRYISVNANTT
jgi:hypothetical protein